MARTTNTRRRQNGRVGGEASAAAVGAPSLVDSAEQALHNWLAGGRYRQGDRLPPEHEVASMLGVSRGTLRSALQRLEESGEIVRRQGSGTFVGRVAVPTALDERLERLEPYSSLASRRGLTLSSVDLRIDRRGVGVEVGEALGLHIDYYVLVNMEGFSKLIDALGGVNVNINYWVPIGGVPDQQLPDDYFRPGPDQHLDGWHALQYARGRYGLSDYLRMDRQRCMLDAVVEAADPTKVLASYPEIASSAEATLQTDIPESALQGFVELGFKAKDAHIRSVVFDDHVINPAYPNYTKIRSIVIQSLTSGGAARPDDTPGEPTAAASSSSAPSTGTPSAASTAPVSDVGDACAYNPVEAQKALAQGEPPTKRG